MASTIILDPTAEATAASSSLSSRPKSLKGLRVGLLHNTKPSGDVILRAIADQLAHDYEIQEVVWYRKPLPTVPASFIREMVSSCDVVITALAD